jgi:hypothetical protein
VQIRKDQTPDPAEPIADLGVLPSPLLGQINDHTQLETAQTCCLIALRLQASGEGLEPISSSGLEWGWGTGDAEALAPGFSSFWRLPVSFGSWLLPSPSKSWCSREPLAHACNPSCSGGRDQEDQCSKPAWANRS